MGIIVTESVEELISKDMSLEKNNKQKEYIDYINNHILFVQKAFNDYFIPLLDKQQISSLISDEDLKIGIEKAANNILEHDASKYGDDEFDGYREKYYPTAEELANEEFQRQVVERFEKAWIHHYKNNWHHPKYWILDDGTKQDMSIDAIIEMICDWLSFNIKSGDPQGVIDWYNNEATHEKDEMTENTKRIVEELLFKIIFKDC